MAKRSQKKSSQQEISVGGSPVLKFETRLVLDDKPTKKTRQRKPDGEPETDQIPRPLSAEEQRKQAAWQEVEQSGKPAVFEDTLLIPTGMNPWQALEHLPAGVKEATEAAMQHTAAKAYVIMVEGMRETILKQAEQKPEWAEYKTYSHAVQMAIADSVYRANNDLPEIPMRELLKQYGAKIAD
jgi:hypothetical protein